MRFFLRRRYNAAINNTRHSLDKRRPGVSIITRIGANAPITACAVWIPAYQGNDDVI